MKTAKELKEITTENNIESINLAKKIVDIQMQAIAPILLKAAEKGLSRERVVSPFNEYNTYKMFAEEMTKLGYIVSQGSAAGGSINGGGNQQIYITISWE